MVLLYTRFLNDGSAAYRSAQVPPEWTAGMPRRKQLWSLEKERLNFLYVGVGQGSETLRKRAIMSTQASGEHDPEGPSPQRMHPSFGGRGQRSGSSSSDRQPS
jgi:hypothetical protein